MAEVLEFRRREQPAPVQQEGPKGDTVRIPDGAVWQCGTCENQLFYITPTGYVCSDCGAFRGVPA